jgi:predicted nuclease with TOPRIM domain
MNLKQILGHIENHEELIKQIEAEIGTDYVPRAEFNEKNNALKTLEKQLGEVNSSRDPLTKEKATHEQTVADLQNKVTLYETASLKVRIAHETGIPYELASRLFGEDEAAIRKDAETLAGFVKNQSLPPLKDNEPAGDDEDAPYRALLNKIKGE